MTREWIAVPPGLPLGDAYRFIEHQFEALFIELADGGHEHEWGWGDPFRHGATRANGLAEYQLCRCGARRRV